LNLSVTEVAVMWILHQGTLLPMSERSLARTIVEFYPVALSAMSRTESLRGARTSDLRLIYFKGLIVAQTHSRQQMVDAIRRADCELDGASTMNETLNAAAQSHIPKLLSADIDMLAHIADALGRSSGYSH